MKQLTDKQKKKYLDSPDVCPNCDSREIEAMDSWEDIVSRYEEWSCRDCSKWWIDTYTLTNVELVDKW